MHCTASGQFQTRRDFYPQAWQALWIHILSVHCVYLEDAITPSLCYTRAYNNNWSWPGNKIFIPQEIPACQYFVSSSAGTKHIGPAVFLAKMEQSICLPVNKAGEPRNQWSGWRIAKELDSQWATPQPAARLADLQLLQRVWMEPGQSSISSANLLN